jgi:hypothetical protein
MAEVNHEDKGATIHIENESQHQYLLNLQMSLHQYMATRLSTLKPPMKIPPNPLKVLGLLSRRDWLCFAVSSERRMESSVLTASCL